MMPNNQGRGMELRPWLFSILHNIFIDQRRRKPEVAEIYPVSPYPDGGSPPICAFKVEG
jgi:DNA-directed RNA polymerase specialized sigma24 family protein